jgi:hypothetical protein
MIMPRGQYQIGGQILSPEGGPAISRPRPRLLESAAALSGGSHVAFTGADPEAFARAVIGSPTGDSAGPDRAATQPLDSPLPVDRVDSAPSGPGPGPTAAVRTVLTRKTETIASAVASLDPVGWLVTAALVALLLESLLDVRRPRLARIPRRRAA